MSWLEWIPVVVVGILAGWFWADNQKLRSENATLRQKNLDLANQYTTLAARVTFILDRWESSTKNVPTK